MAANTHCRRPRQAMVLAAGLGLRMRPLTERLPKPLIRVAGRTLLDRAIDRLEGAGVETVVVNAHYLAEKITRHLATRRTPAIRVSCEDTLLETGGGVAHALPLLRCEPLFVVNGDVLWLDETRPALDVLAEAWDDRRMDALLVLHETRTAFGYQGDGDFLIDAEGRLMRRPAHARAPFLFAGLQILTPTVFSDAPRGAFSLNVIYDRAIAAGRLFGVVFQGRWFHVGTPDDLAIAEAYFQNQQLGAGP